MGLVVAYVAGVLTIPALFVLAAVLDGIHSGAWVTARTECRHEGPDGREIAWRVFWRCPQPIDDDDTPCRGRWVRKYVARVLPALVLRTKPVGPVQ